MRHKNERSIMATIDEFNEFRKLKGFDDDIVVPMVNVYNLVNDWLIYCKRNNLEPIIWDEWVTK
jgi:hypothetical protein